MLKATKHYAKFLVDNTRNPRRPQHGLWQSTRAHALRLLDLHDTLGLPYELYCLPFQVLWIFMKYRIYLYRLYKHRFDHLYQFSKIQSSSGRVSITKLPDKAVTNVQHKNGKSVSIAYKLPPINQSINTEVLAPRRGQHCTNNNST